MIQNLFLSLHRWTRFRLSSTTCYALLAFTPGWPHESCPALRLGWESAKPLIYMDSKQKLTGIDYEIVSAVMREMGCSLQYDAAETPWARQLLSVANGKLDVIVGASKTKERKQYAWFSDVYRVESVMLVVRKGESGKYPIKDLSNFMNSPLGTLGIYRGSFYGKDFTNWMKNPVFKSRTYESGSDSQSIRMLGNHRLDGILLDTISGTVLLKSDPALLQIAERHPMQPMITGQVQVMFSKKTIPESFVTRFNTALKKLRQEGKLEAIIKDQLEKP